MVHETGDTSVRYATYLFMEKLSEDEQVTPSINVLRGGRGLFSNSSYSEGRGLFSNSSYSEEFSASAVAISSGHTSGRARTGVLKAVNGSY